MQKASRKRVMPSWHPTWTREVESWTSKQINENMWRFTQFEDRDDIMQEARLLWIKVERNYPIVNEAPHFFALYKTSLSRMFIDKQRKANRDIRTEKLPEELPIHGTPNYGYFNVLLDEMPDELKLVLQALTTGRVRLKLDRPTKTMRVRENLNKRLKRRLPTLSLTDPVGDLRRILRYNS